MTHIALALAVLSLTIPCSFGAGLTVSPESLASELVWGHAFASVPRLASNGDTFMLGWQVGYPNVSPASVRFGRFTREGVGLDRGGIPIFGDRLLDVIWNGADYVFFVGMGGPDYGLFAQRVSADGILQGESVKVGPIPATPFTVASNGQHTVIVTRPSWTYEFQLEFYSRDLILQKRVLLDFKNLDAPLETPSISTNGRNFLLTWTGERKFGAIVTNFYAVPISGTSFEPESAPRTHALEESVYRGTLASDGEGYLQVWDGEYGIRALALDPSGIASGRQEPLSERRSLSVQDLVWSGESFFVFAASGEVFSVARSGRVITQTSAFSSSSLPMFGYRMLSAARAGDRVLLAWTREHPAISGALFASTGARIPDVYDALEFPLAESFTRQHHPSASFDGESDLVAWSEIIDGRGQIFVGRVTRSGEVLDGRGIWLAASNHSQLLPAVAFCGDRFIVIWYEISREGYTWIRGRMVNRDGVALGNGSFTVSSNPLYPIGIAAPSVAGSSSGALVAFTVKDENGRRVRAARVSLDGVVLDPEGFPVAFSAISPLTGRPHQSAHPSVAYAEGSYLVSWTEFVEVPATECHFDPCPTIAFDTDIRATLVSPAGVVLSHGIPVSTTTAFDERSVAISLGSRFMVLWTTARTRVLAAVQISPDGKVIAGSDGATSYDGLGIAAAFDGRDVLVVGWKYDDDQSHLHAYRARIDGGKTILSSVGSIGFENVKWTPAATAIASGEFRVYSEKRLSQIGGEPVRIVTAVVRGWPPGRSRTVRR